MNEVYSAAYCVTGDAVIQLLAPACTAPAVSPAPTFSTGCGVGEGFAIYGAELCAIKSDLESVQADRYPTARSVAHLAWPVFRDGRGQSANDAQPIYVRDKVALTTAERLARGGVR